LRPVNQNRFHNSRVFVIDEPANGALSGTQMWGWIKIGIGLASVSGNAFAQTIAESAGSYATTESNLSLAPASNGTLLPVGPAETFGAGNSRATAYGYDFGNGFKTEIEGSSFNAASDRLNGLAGTGNLMSTRVTLKGMYEFTDGAWHVKPYVGAGLGVVDVDAHNLGMTGNEWATAYQLHGGVALGFTQKLVGSLEYRWTNGSKPSFALAGVPTKVEVDRHGFVVGFNYKY
jgi:opacity protein-like surface antigen